MIVDPLNWQEILLLSSLPRVAVKYKGIREGRNYEATKATHHPRSDSIGPIALRDFWKNIWRKKENWINPRENPHPRGREGCWLGETTWNVPKLHLGRVHRAHPRRTVGGEGTATWWGTAPLSPFRQPEFRLSAAAMWRPTASLVQRNCGWVFLWMNLRRRQSPRLFEYGKICKIL